MFDLKFSVVPKTCKRCPGTWVRMNIFFSDAISLSLIGRRTSQRASLYDNPLVRTRCAGFLGL